MILITFAHKKEAASFLKNNLFITYNFLFSGVYKSIDNSKLILITGEGIQNTTEKLSSIMTHFYQEITEVYNLGIAASLDNSLELHKIYPIKTCLTEQIGNNFPDPKKIETNCPNAIFSCLTTHRKIINPVLAQNLFKIAPIVDMESWAIGSVCKLYDVPFYPYKLISDFPNRDNCHNLEENIKKKSSQFSLKLHDFFNALTLM